MSVPVLTFGGKEIKGFASGERLQFPEPDPDSVQLTLELGGERLSLRTSELIELVKLARKVSELEERLTALEDDAA